ncbi:putative CBF/NF-Y family transcription factor [Aspergillus undulatus]|uniref:putative CBF/NF-Y family transcription factor n=1 Tax=Aspergillus undulatus TaxID=1810928 RepID=UPI003CCCEEE2
MSSTPQEEPDATAAAADQPQPETTKPVQVQATEQQLKARAEGVSIEVRQRSLYGNPCDAYKDQEEKTNAKPSIQDYLLPRSITLRLAKSVLPPNTSVQKDAVLAIQKAATVFVSYLSSHANEATPKRTVSPADVLNAISELEFEGFRPRLEKELDMFSEMKAAKRRPRKSGDGDGDAAPAAGGGEEQAEGPTGTGPIKKEVAVRGAKRVKRDGAGNEVVDEEDEDHDMEDEGEGEGDGVEAEEEEHEEDADATEEEEEDDEHEDEGREYDVDRVEDLDRGARARRMMDPDAGGDTDSDEEGPGSQLRGDLELG